MLADPLSTTDVVTDFPRKLGEFTLQAELGRGGSGVVFAALWGHREIALKVLHPDQIATDKFREQFLMEARRLSELAHPGVVKVLAVGVIDERPYVAMERLRGETLAERLMRGALPLALALEIAQQLAAAVAAMHTRNLVHRDLKPENVFLVDAQHAVLLDFGIAKDLFSSPSTTTQDGGIRGTPAYMAPERFFGQAAGVATDVYELAVVVYAMIAARLPWDSISDPAARLDPKPLVEAPSAIDSLLRTAMSTRAANRPTSVADFAAQLRVSGGDDDSQPHETQPLPAQVGESGAAQPVAEMGTGPTLSLASPTPSSSAPGESAHAGATPPWFSRVTPTVNPRSHLAGRDRNVEPHGVDDAAKVAANIAQPWPSREQADQVTLDAASVAAHTARSTRRPVVTGAIALVAVVSSGVMWWQLRDRPASALSATRVLPPVVMLPAASDPWNIDGTARNPSEVGSGSAGVASLLATPGAQPTQGLERGAERPTSEATAEDTAVAASIATAITRVPHGTSIIATASLSGWRRNADAMRIIEVALAKPTVVELLAAMPACMGDLVSHAQWVVVSAKSRGMEDGYIVQLGGIASAQAAQACLAADNVDGPLDGKVRATWARILDGTLLWRDQTLVFSSYRNVTAAKVWTGGRGFGLVGRSRELYARVQPGAALALVADMPNGPVVDGLPAGTDVVASVGLPVGKVVVELSAETRNVADAEALEASGKKQLATMLGASNELINVAVSRDGNVVRLHGKLPPMILHVVASALAE